MKKYIAIALSVFAMLGLSAVAQAGVLKDHQGRWLGDMNLPDGRVLRIGAELLTRADGTPWASFTCPTQDAYDVPVKHISASQHGVALDFSLATLKLTWAGDHFDGLYVQNGQPFKLTLYKVAQFPRRVRQQTPQGPFPYREQALAIASGDGVTLGATLTIPAGKVRPNLAVLVAGSGPSARDGGVAGHQALTVVADHLARQGIAVLRYDKRGVAHSSGKYEQHTVVKLADDLHSVLRALRARKQFAKVGVVGFSEGAAIAAGVAARDRAAIDFVVSLAGVGVTGRELLLLQDRIYAADKGATAQEVQRLMAYVRKFYQAVIHHRQPGPRVAALQDVFDALSPEDQALVRKREMDKGTLSLDWAAQPFVRASLLSDPPAHWRTVRVPVLVLNGSLDHQVPANENVAGIVAALQSGGNSRVESAILPSLNHLFQTAGTGADDEYAGLPETIAPAVLQRIATFVSKQR